MLYHTFDHRPLHHIFRQAQPVPALVPAGLQRWAVMLGAYTYRVTYRPRLEILHADGLSQLPLP